MVEKQKQVCTNGCKFGTKKILIGKTGDREDWLYRCSVLDRLVTLDCAIWKVGCATFTTGNEPMSVKAESLVKEAEDVLVKINRQIEEQKKMEVKK